MLSILCRHLGIAKREPESSQHPSDPPASCRPNPSRPSVRLAWLQLIELYGFPPTALSNPNANFLFLQDPGLAYLSYILGEDWQSRLRVHHDRHSKDYRYLPIPGNDADEAEHCLRMRRCGAISVKDLDEVQARKNDDGPGSLWPLQETEKYIFGWPESGGVWVFRIPREVWKSSIPEPGSPDYIRAIFEYEENYARLSDKIEGMQRSIKEQSEMDGVCDILSDAGAIWYPDIKDCSEAQDMNLVEASH